MKSTPLRRSHRAPKPKVRYEDEVTWDDKTLRLLRADSDTGSDTSNRSAESRPSVNHSTDQGVNLPEPSDNESSIVDADFRSTHDAQEDEENLRDSTINTPEPLTPSRSSRYRPRISNRELYADTFGPNLEDLSPILQSRDIWYLDSRDLVFPSRKSLTQVLALEADGKYLERPREKHFDKDLSNHQVTEKITYEEAIAGRYVEKGEDYDVVLGPSDDAHKCIIGFQDPFPTGGCWLPKNVPGAKIDAAYRKGLLFNLGARPQCLAWAPSTSDDQYLAVSLRCSKPQRDAIPPNTSNLAPAFSPSSSCPSHIQIWHVKAKPGDTVGPAQIYDHDVPRLTEVMCTRYGNIIKMEWLPSTAESRLCILSSDGNIRILNVTLKDREDTRYSRIEHPQFVATPPEGTVFTCFGLPNAYDLVAADATGAVHLYSLRSSDSNLKPHATFQVHMTYIMAVISIPAHPHLICTTSAAGEVILTDVRSPVADRIRVWSSRLPTRNLAYLPFTRSFLTTLDSVGCTQPKSFGHSTVVSHQIRNFSHYDTILRLPALGGVSTVLAASQIHPIILVANASGTVIASNYLRRTLSLGLEKKEVGKGRRKIKGIGNDARASAWMARVFEYEWRPLTKEELQQRKEEEEITTMAVGVAQKEYGPLSGFKADEARCSQFVNQAVKEALAKHRQERDEDEQAGNSANLDEDTVMADNKKDATQEIDLYHGPSKPRLGMSRFTEGIPPERVQVLKAETSKGSMGMPTTKSKSKSKSQPKKGGVSKVQETATKGGRPKKAPAMTGGRFDGNNDADLDTTMDVDAEKNGVDKDNDDHEDFVWPETSGSSQVIYPEEQAVTAMAWNGNGGNSRFATWAAIGWGSGLVRVMDLGHDLD